MIDFKNVLKGCDSHRARNNYRYLYNWLPVLGKCIHLLHDLKPPGKKKNFFCLFSFFLIFFFVFIFFKQQMYGIQDIYPDNTSPPNFARPWQAKWSLQPAGGLNPLLCCHCHAVLVPQWAKIFYMKFVLAGD